MSKLKAFQVDDCTWYAAHTAEEAVDLYLHDVGESVDDGYPTEVTDEALDTEIPELDEGERPTSRMTTMRVFLDEMTEPGFLATTEW